LATSGDFKLATDTPSGTEHTDSDEDTDRLFQLE